MSNNLFVSKENVRRDTVSCNFCARGELNLHKNGLVYPYENVYTFKRIAGSGLCASICQDCINELFEKSKQLTP